MVGSLVERNWNLVGRKEGSVSICQYVRGVMLWLMIIGRSSILPVMKG